MSSGKEAARDLRYGRRGGRWAAEPAVDQEWFDIVPTLPEPADVSAHLVEDHQMPADVVDVHTADEHAVWHAAEHRTRHPGVRQPMHAGHLLHTHEQYLPKRATKGAAA